MTPRRHESMTRHANHDAEACRHCRRVERRKGNHPSKPPGSRMADKRRGADAIHADALDTLDATP